MEFKESGYSVVAKSWDSRETGVNGGLDRFKEIKTPIEGRERRENERLFPYEIERTSTKALTYLMGGSLSGARIKGGTVIRRFGHESAGGHWRLRRVPRARWAEARQWLLGLVINAISQRGK